MQYNAIQWNTMQFNVIKNRYTSLIAKEKMVKDSLVGAENTMTDLWWMFRQPVHSIPSNGLSPCDCVIKCQSLCRDSNPKQTFLSRSLFHLRHSTKNYIDLLHLGGGLALPTLVYNYHFPGFVSVEPFTGCYVRIILLYLVFMFSYEDTYWKMLLLFTKKTLVGIGLSHNPR